MDTPTQKTYEQELFDFAVSHSLPASNLPAEFSDWVRRAFRYVAPVTINMTTAEWANVQRVTDNIYNLLDLGNVLRVIQTMTMDQMEMPFTEYETMQSIVEHLGRLHAEAIKPEQVRLQRKYATIQRIQQGGGKIRPLGQA